MLFNEAQLVINKRFISLSPPSTFTVSDLLRLHTYVCEISAA